MTPSSLKIYQLDSEIKDMGNSYMNDQVDGKKTLLGPSNHGLTKGTIKLRAGMHCLLVKLICDWLSVGMGVFIKDENRKSK